MSESDVRTVQLDRHDFAIVTFAIYIAAHHVDQVAPPEIADDWRRIYARILREDFGISLENVGKALAVALDQLDQDSN